MKNDCFLQRQLLLILLILYNVNGQDCKALLLKMNQSNVDERLRCSNPSGSCWMDGSMGGYFTNEEVEKRFSWLHCLYPQFVRA